MTNLHSLILHVLEYLHVMITHNLKLPCAVPVLLTCLGIISSLFITWNWDPVRDYHHYLIEIICLESYQCEGLPGALLLDRTCVA
jgi:hypothetical protein